MFMSIAASTRVTNASLLQPASILSLNTQRERSTTNSLALNIHEEHDLDGLLALLVLDVHSFKPPGCRAHASWGWIILIYPLVMTQHEIVCMASHKACAENPFNTIGKLHIEL